MRFWPLPPLRPRFDAAVRDTRSKDPRYRILAAEALGHAEPDRAEEALRALGRLIADEVPEVRWNAVGALGALGGDEAIHLLSRAAPDPDPDVRIAVLDSLCRIGDAGAASSVIARAASDSVGAVRAAFANATLRLRGVCPDVLEEILALAEDPEPEVRAAVAACLEHFGDQAHEALTRLVDDADPEVRIEAAFAIATLGDRLATPLLLPLLSDRRAAREAAEALGWAGDPAAVPALRELLERWLVSPWTRVAAAAALARLGDRDGARALVEILRRKRHDAVAVAAEEAATLGMEEAREPIRCLAERPPRALGAGPFERALRILDGLEPD